MKRTLCFLICAAIMFSASAFAQQEEMQKVVENIVRENKEQGGPFKSVSYLEDGNYIIYEIEVDVSIKDFESKLKYNKENQEIMAESASSIEIFQESVNDTHGIDAKAWVIVSNKRNEHLFGIKDGKYFEAPPEYSEDESKTVCDSGMEEYEELIDLYAQAGRELWYATEWESVVLPLGVWEIGVDIPAGRYTITAATETSSTFVYGNKLLGGGIGVSQKSEIASEYLWSKNNPGLVEGLNDWKSDLDLKDGSYLWIRYGTARLTPKDQKRKYKFPSASTLDTYGMSKKELYKLRKEIKEEITGKDAYRTFVIEEGFFTFDGEHEGRWQVTPKEGGMVNIEFGVPNGGKFGDVFASMKSETSKEYDKNSTEYQVDLYAEEGMNIFVKKGSAVFSPFIGKKDIIFE